MWVRASGGEGRGGHSCFGMVQQGTTGPNVSAPLDNYSMKPKLNGPNGYHVTKTLTLVRTLRCESTLRRIFSNQKNNLRINLWTITLSPRVYLTIMKGLTFPVFCFLFFWGLTSSYSVQLRNLKSERDQISYHSGPKLRVSAVIFLTSTQNWVSEKKKKHCDLFSQEKTRGM